MGKTRALASWWRRNVIASDPAPALSRLDVADGLGTLLHEPVTLTDEQVDRLWGMVTEPSGRMGS